MTVMISYSSADEKVATEVWGKLNAAALDTWIDKEGIKAGTQWREELIKQLKTCDVFVVLLSKSYLRSEHCRMELFLARTFERKILPVMLDDCWNALDADESTRGLRDIFMIRLFELKVINLPITRDEAWQRLVDAAAGKIRKVKRPVYISHLNPDAKIATELSLHLESSGVPTWSATLHTPIGADWRRVQSRALAEASCHLVFLNAGFTAHPIVRTELLTGEALGLPIYTLHHPAIATDRTKIENLNRELSSSDQTYRRVYSVNAAKTSDKAPYLDAAFVELLRQVHHGRRKLF